MNQPQDPRNREFGAQRGRFPVPQWSVPPTPQQGGGYSGPQQLNGGSPAGQSQGGFQPTTPATAGFLPPRQPVGGRFPAPMPAGGQNANDCTRPVKLKYIIDPTSTMKRMIPMAVKPHKLKKPGEATTKLKRPACAITTVGAIAALLAGCGGSGTSTVGGGGTTDVAAPAVTRSAKEVVLTAAELPAGIEVIAVTDAQLQSALGQITSSADTLKAVPAECGSKTAIVDATAALDVSKFGMIAGSAKSDFVSESVLVAHPDIAKLRSAFAGPCKTMTADLTSQGVSVSSQITRTVLDAPKGKATDLLVVREDSTSNAAGQRVTQQSYQGYAQVGGYAVTVSVKALSGTPDKKLFDDLLEKSIAKAAQA